MERVVDEGGEEGHHDHRDRAAVPGIVPLEHEPAVVEDEQQQEHAGDPGPGCAPAEPVEGARHQLGNHLLLGVPVQDPAQGPVDEVEEVEHPDPDDPREDVQPAEECIQYIHGQPPSRENRPTEPPKVSTSLAVKNGRGGVRRDRPPPAGPGPPRGEARAGDPSQAGSGAMSTALVATAMRSIGPSSASTTTRMPWREPGGAAPWRRATSTVIPPRGGTSTTGGGSGATRPCGVSTRTRAR